MEVVVQASLAGGVDQGDSHVRLHCGSLAQRIRRQTLSGCRVETAVEAYLVSISKLSRPTESLWYFLPMSESVRIPPLLTRNTLQANPAFRTWGAVMTCRGTPIFFISIGRRVVHRL